MKAKTVTRYRCGRCLRTWQTENSAEGCCRCRCGKPVTKFSVDSCDEHDAVNAIRRFRRARKELTDRIGRIDAHIATEKARIPQRKAARK